MLLHSLRLTNFRQHASTHIEFPRGLTAIVGRNGAGKSTILEAIAWALYGMPAARGTAETIRFNRAAQRAPVRVELEFTYGPHVYMVSRSLNGCEVYRDGVVATDGLKASNEYLAMVLAMTRPEFFNTYFTGQKELEFLAGMGGADRARFISRVLGYDRLQAAQEACRKRSRAIVEEMTKLKGRTREPAEIQRKLNDLTGQIDAIKTDGRITRESWRTAHQAALELRPRLDAMELEYSAVQLIREKLAAVDAELAQCRRDIEWLGRSIVEAEASEHELAAHPSPDFVELERLVQETTRALADAESARSALETEHRANVRRADQAEAAWRQSLSLAVAEVTRLTKLKPGAPCSECTREMTLEHIEAAIATAQAQANRVDESAQLRVWEALRAEPDELKVDSAAGIRSAYTKARVLLDTARAQDRDMANLRKLWEVKARDLPKLRQQSEQLHARGLELEARRAALHVQAPISEPSHDELTALRRGLREREDMAAVQSGRMNRLIGELDAMQSQWQQLSDELVQALETSATVNGLVAASRTHAELDTAYAELRTTLNARVRPELASTASQIMSELTHGRYTGIDLDDGYNLSVLDGGEPKPVISGGEEDVASLAVRLSISSMIAQRSGRPVSLLLLDEIFGSLDDERRDSVIALLRQLQGRFEQVVLITHVEGIQDSVDQLVRVEWDERSGASIARVA